MAALLPPDPIYVLRSVEMGQPNCITFHQNERILAGTFRGTIHVWDMQARRLALTIPFSKKPVLSIYHTTESMVASEHGGVVKTWQLGNAGYEPGPAFDGKPENLCRIDVSPTRHMVVCPKGKSDIAVCNIDGMEVQHVLTPPNPEEKGMLSMLKIHYISGVDYVMAGYESGHVITYDSRTRRVFHETKLDHCQITADYDPELNQGYMGGQSNILHVFGYRQERMEYEARTQLTVADAGVHVIRIRSDKKVFACGAFDGKIGIYSWRSLRPLAVLTQHKATVTDIAYSDGRVAMFSAPLMAASSMDGSISLWNIYNNFN